MRNECTHDWNAIASVWDQFENHGLSPTLLDDDPVRSLPVPLVVVGCGRGQVLQHLQKKLGHEQVYGLDTSEKMVAAAKQRGCANVHLVSGDDLNIGVDKFETIILATGVMDPMEHSEMASFIESLTQKLSERGRLWIYVFGQFGPNWKVASALNATCPLGIANNVLFDLYEQASSTSLERALSEHGILRSNGLVAKTWMHSIRRFLNEVIDKAGGDEQTALRFVRSVSPRVQRRFAQHELNDVIDDSECLHIESVHKHNQAGVLRVIATHAAS